VRYNRRITRQRSQRMTDKKRSILELKISELQFRLAAMVRLETSLKNQPLDAPTAWSHGKHEVSYEEIALTRNQADLAADYFERTATYLMAITIKEALECNFTNLTNHSDKNVVAAYQIARMIRNAFAHSPIKPIWRIKGYCRDKEFIVDNVIALNTRGLDQQPFDWRHYGGLLALFKLSKYVRINLLGDTDIGKKRKIPSPKNKIIQQGNLILQEVDKIPKGAKRIYF